MAGTCTFNVGKVRKLFNHSKAALVHTASMSHLFEAKYHKGGVVLCKDGKPYKENSKEMMWPDSDNIDQSLIPAGLILVGDHGIYLMSNGSPSLLVEEGKSNNVVAYAKESDPTSDAECDEWYEAKRRIFGGDDGTIPLPLDMFEKAMELPDDATFKVKVTTRNVSVIVAEAPVKLAAGMKVRFKAPLEFKSGFKHALYRIDQVKEGLCVAIDEKGLPTKRVKLSMAGLRNSIRSGDAEIVS